MAKVIASHKSIQKQIEENVKNPFDALAEYIWNAIDANAKNIGINIVLGQNYIKSLEIIDDGDGIDRERLETELFSEFNNSHKTKVETMSLPHGNKGFGRFSFIKFSERVRWVTTYLSRKDNKKYKYNIVIEKHALAEFNPTEQETSFDTVGTKVIFDFTTNSNTILLNLKDKDLLSKLKESLCLEFCWVIELLNINILINSKNLDYSEYIELKKDKYLQIDNIDFSFKFINWKKALKNQSSRYYLLNSRGKEVYVDTTSLNNKNDEFYHSLYVTSQYFNDFNLFKTRYEETYKKLLQSINNYLRKQRRPYIEKFSARKIEEFESDKLFPNFDDFEEKVKKPIYIEVVREIIEFAPRLVSYTNDTQRKVLLRLIYQLLDDEEKRKTLYNILEILVDDDNKEYLEELEEKLRKYGLKNILGLIKLVESRLETINNLKEMIYSDNFYFMESDLQRVIEGHFWIFGEEYNLMLCAEEDDFTKLRDIYYEKVLKIKKEDYEDYKLSKKQVDLFICGANGEGRINKNLIIEIKRPSKNIDYSNFRQIEDYSREINKESQLNNPERDKWDFILLCKDIVEKDRKDFEDKYIDKFTGLIQENKKNIRIFVIKWSDLLREVEFRLNFLKQKLQIKKAKLMPAKKDETKESFLRKFDNSATLL